MTVNDATPLWPELDHTTLLRSHHDLHVIRVSLAGSRCDSIADWPELSADEHARANRYVVEPPRRRFRLCRRALRHCLGFLTQSPPAEIQFASERNGKPVIRTAHGESLGFNVSHTSDWGVIAVAWGRQLGVDIETLDPHLDVLALANRFFSTEEQAELEALPPDDQRRGFYRLWTSKEAYMKALGLGMLLPLGSFTMRANPYWPPELLSGDIREGPWQLTGFEVNEMIPGVLMFNGEPAKVHYWTAPPDW